MGEVDCKCGIFVAHSLHDVYKGLQGVQNRGQDAAGVACLRENGDIDVVRWQGTVDTFSLNNLNRILEGGILFTGEVRYSTCRGDQNSEDLFQGALPRVHGGILTSDYKSPFFTHNIVRGADIAVCHNGNLEGVVPRGKDTDTDVLMKFYLMQELSNACYEVIKNFPAAFSCAVLDRRRKDVQVFKDRYAIRPLWIGEKDGRIIASSEDKAIVDMGGKPMRELRPGEIINIHMNGNHYSSVQVVKRRKAPCFFEANYLSSVLSSFDGVINKDIRRREGVILIDEMRKAGFDFNQTNAISFVPDAPEDAARAAADYVGIPFVEVFYKFKKIRAFLGASEEDRSQSIGKNLYVKDRVSLPGDDCIPHEGLRLLLIEDSIVRFNNLVRAVEKLRSRGVSYIVGGVCTPPLGPLVNEVPCGCYFGVDMPPDDNFAIRKYSSIPEMARAGQLDYLYFISKKGLQDALRRPLSKCCAHCIGEPNPVQPAELAGLEAIINPVYERFPA